MAANGSRYEQLCVRFVTALALMLGYSVKTEAGNEGWKLTDNPQAPDIRIFKREQDLHRNDGKPPRVVLVPQGGPIVSPDQVGPFKDPQSNQLIKIVRVRQFSIQVYCWGQDSEQSEDLMHNAINAFQGTRAGSAHDSANGAHNAVNFSSEVWEDQKPGEGGPETYGSQISFLATFQILVTTKPQLLTNVTHVAHVHNTVTLLDDTENVAL